MEKNNETKGQRNMKKLRMLPWVLGCASLGLSMGVIGTGCGDDDKTEGTGGTGGAGGTGGVTPDAGASPDGAAAGMGGGGAGGAGTGGGMGGMGGTAGSSAACKNEMKPITGDVMVS